MVIPCKRRRCDRDKSIDSTLTLGRQSPNILEYDSVNQSPGNDFTDTCILRLD